MRRGVDLDAVAAVAGGGIQIFNEAGQGRDINFDRAWAAALTLIIIVLVLYAIARLLTRRNTLARR